MTRTYDMTGREAARRHTRESILAAAVELFTPSWYDEVTLGDVARRAGVSQQTVVNHFGSKIELYLTALREHALPQIAELRGRAVPGDVRSVVSAIVADYEFSGDSTFRLLALAQRLPELQELVRDGRRAHTQFVTSVLGPLLPEEVPADRLRLLVAALDVTMWHQLRRSEGLDPDQTEQHLVLLLESLLPAAAEA